MYQTRLKLNSIALILLTVIEDLPNYVELKNNEFWVTNPKNNQENFAEKWNEIPKRFIAFERWHQEVKKFFQELSKSEGMDVVTNSLKEAYGDRVTTAALNSLEGKIAAKRSIGALGVTGAGMITGTGDTKAATSIPKNTFYGKK